MHAKFGLDPRVGSKKLPFKFNNRLIEILMNVCVIYTDVITSTPVRDATSTDVLATVNVRMEDGAISTVQETYTAGLYNAFITLDVASDDVRVPTVTENVENISSWKVMEKSLKMGKTNRVMKIENILKKSWRSHGIILLLIMNQTL